MRPLFTLRLSSLLVLSLLPSVFAQQPSTPVRVFESPEGQTAPATAPATVQVRPGVELIQARPLDTQALSSRKSSYTFTVQPGDWMDTGVEVVPGDHLDFSASGTLTLSDQRSSAPDGVARGWKDLLRQFPLNSANAGALIGRISSQGACVALQTCARKPKTGTINPHLYLSANLISDLCSEK